MKFSNAILTSALAAMIASAAEAQNLAQNFNFDGVLVDTSNNPLTGPVALQFDIYNPAESCLLYRETHAAVALDAAGAFSIKVGTGARDTSADGNVPFTHIFQNAAQVRAIGTNCSVAYNPATGDGRKLRVSVNGTALAPMYSLSPSPSALVAQSAQTLGGKTAADFFLANPNTPQTLRFSNGTNTIGFAPPGTIPSNLVWTLPGSDGSAGQVLSTNGSGALSWITPSGGASYPTCSAGQTLTSNGSTLTCVIPAVSGNSITMGTIGGSTEINTTGNITTTGALQTNTLSSANTSTRNFRIFDSSNGTYVQIATPTSIVPYTLTLPTTAGAAGQMMTTNGAGILSWSTPPPPNVNLGQIRSTVNPGNPVFPGAACTPEQTLRYSNITDQFQCDPIPALMMNGNSAGTQVNVGTNDSYPLRFRTNGAERMAIDSTGNVGIGTTLPASVLHVVASPSFGSFTISRTTTSINAFTKYTPMSPSAGQPAWMTGLPGSQYGYMIASFDGTTSTPRVFIDPNGNVGVNTMTPAYRMDIDGDLRITGTPYRTGGDVAWTVPSDKRLKDVGGALEYGLDEISKIETLRYHYKKDNNVGADSSKEYTGVLAQQIQELIPEAVELRGEYLTLNTTPIFWSMVNAIKELKERAEKAEALNKDIRAYLCAKDPAAPICH